MQTRASRNLRGFAGSLGTETDVIAQECAHKLVFNLVRVSPVLNTFKAVSGTS